MPTNQNAYNSRVTDESLEKKFRDTFKSQGGAELVDDLYASGVIVPVVDFSAAATGEVLGSDLQTAWDFSTGHINLSTGSTTFITNPGFWLVDLVWCGYVIISGSPAGKEAKISITDGSSTKIIWRLDRVNNTTDQGTALDSEKFVVFLRSGDSLEAAVGGTTTNSLNVSYRQIADVSGNLINPLGFTSS